VQPIGQLMMRTRRSFAIATASCAWWRPAAPPWSEADALQLRDAVHDGGDLEPELGLDVTQLDLGVLHGVVQEAATMVVSSSPMSATMRATANGWLMYGLAGTFRCCPGVRRRRHLVGRTTSAVDAFG